LFWPGLSLSFAPTVGFVRETSREEKQATCANLLVVPTLPWLRSSQKTRNTQCQQSFTRPVNSTTEEHWNTCALDTTAACQSGTSRADYGGDERRKAGDVVDFCCADPLQLSSAHHGREIGHGGSSMIRGHLQPGDYMILCSISGSASLSILIPSQFFLHWQQIWHFLGHSMLHSQPSESSKS
jgi:hypothetical protein